MGYIYQILNKITNKSYIGQTREKNPFTRINRHFRENQTHKNSYIRNTIKKYGEDVFEVILLEKNISNELLNSAELFYISFLQTKVPNGYNLNKGGGNFFRAKEMGQKISKALKGKKLTKEHRKKLSDAKKGRKLPEKTKRKMSEAQKRINSDPLMRQRKSKKMKGFKMDPEIVRRIAELNRGQKRSEETRRRISESKKGIKPSKETLEKRSISISKAKGTPEARKRVSEKMKTKLWVFYHEMNYMRNLGLSYKKLGRIYNCGPNTVKTILNRKGI